MYTPSVTPKELNRELRSGQPLLLLDVREADELDISCLEGVVNIPLADLPFQAGDLDKEADIVVICRSGGRSAKGTHFLISQGYRRVRNLAGGMNAWAAEVDPRLPQY